MRNRNFVELVGTVAASYGVKQFTNSKKADIRVYTEEPKNYTTVVGWDDMADQLGELEEGDTVHIRGHLKSRSWEKDGKKTWVLEVVADEVVPARAGEIPI